MSYTIVIREMLSVICTLISSAIAQKIVTTMQKTSLKSVLSHMLPSAAVIQLAIGLR